MFRQFVRIFVRENGWKGALVLLAYGVCFVVIVGWIVAGVIKGTTRAEKLGTAILGGLVVAGMAAGAWKMASDFVRFDQMPSRAPKEGRKRK